MTLPARCRNPVMADRRCRIGSRHDLMRIAMTILAGGRWRLARFAGLRVQRSSPGMLRIRVALLARDLFRRLVMRQALHVFVAVHAGEFHGRVNGVLELFRVHVEREGLAVYLGGESCVTMAGETVFVFQLVLGASGEGRAQQKERQRTEQYSAGNFHAYEKTPMRF